MENTVEGISAPVSPKVPDIVLVEGKTVARTFEVSTKDLRCTCGHAGCYHATLVEDVYFKKGKRFRFDIISALHKEIRRNDISRALAFGRLYFNVSGDYPVRTYVHNIILEETRNSLLWNRWIGDFDWQNWVLLLAGSRKKWECRCRRGLFDHKVDSFVRALELESYSTLGEIENAMLSFESIDEFYVRMFRVFKQWDKKQIEVMELALKARVARESVNLPEWLGKIRNENLGVYGVMLVGEALCGKWDSECDQIRKSSLISHNDLNFIPAFRDYVYDLHTFVGKVRLSKAWSEIKPGVPMPKGLDMRWSGMTISVLWRSKAFEQFGDGYVNTSWEAVEIEPALWRKTKIYDRWWYKKFYAQVEPE